MGSEPGKDPAGGVVVVELTPDRTCVWEGPVVVELRQLPRRIGRQLTQDLPAFTQEQFLQVPVRLQRQQVMLVPRTG